ncbi:chitin synthase-domain-containing protein [Lipomyces oligophaga]|uniref:chitin synthase-domain-containing protein n=1 Tax=Lipomyces oligophaga TaxID=45792 RepID=UPI0034CE744F
MPPVSDISQLPAGALTDQGITAHLGARFHNGLPISSISSHTIISINTFSSPDDNEISALASRAFDRLRRRAESQLIVFLGESGSGKSELRNLVSTRLHSLTNGDLSSRISAAIFIFSALTTTKNQSTPVSSKAGLLLEYQYNSDAALTGSKFVTYRLDRERVAHVPPGERNFHIFYYLLAGTSPSERLHLGLDPNTRYRYLGHPTQLKIGINDNEGFSHFRTALRRLNFSRTEIAELSQIFAAILHIGQLEFAPASPESDGDENHATVKNRSSLTIIASFLGVRPDDLEAALVYKLKSFKKERVTIILDDVGARAHADDLARTLYAMTEQWVMEAINDKLTQDDSLIDNTISIIDFPGFTPQLFGVTLSGPEILNQLLYNTANETLYNYMINACFQRMTDQFEIEDLRLPSAEYFDNTETVKLLTKPRSGILPLLDDQTRRFKSPTSVFDHMRKRYLKNPALELSPQSGSFIIKHYDGEVSYTVDRLLDANSDDISGDLMNLFATSSSFFFQNLCGTKAVVAIKHPRQHSTILQGQLSSKPLRQPSLLRKQSVLERQAASQPPPPPPPPPEKEQKSYTATGQFSAALDVMTASFKNSNPYFVHCIKPNERRIDHQFDVKCVRHQVHALGLSDVARRVQMTDVSLFLSFGEVLGLSGLDESSMIGASDADKVRQIIIDHSWSDRDVLIGSTGVFLSETAWRNLVDPSDSYIRATRQSILEPFDKNPFGSTLQLPPENSPSGLGSYVYEEAGRSTDVLTLGGSGTNDMFDNIETPIEVPGKITAENEEEIDLVATSRARKIWLALVKWHTWWVPERLIASWGKMPRPDVRLAWREKLTINMIIATACLMTVFFVVGFPSLLCPTQHVLSLEELSSYNSDDSTDKVYVAIRGQIFDLSKTYLGHYPSIVSKTDVLDYGGTDATALFPVQVSALCQGVNGSIHPAVTFDYEGKNTTDENSIYHDFRWFTGDYRPDWYMEMIMNFKPYKKADVGYTAKTIKKEVNSESKVMAIIHGNIYDFTSYIAGGRQLLAPDGVDLSDEDISTDFMDSSVVDIFQSGAGTDISKEWDELDLDSDLRSRMDACLHNLFYIGKLDHRNSVRCQFSRYFLLVVSLFLVSVIGVKFLAALQFSKSRIPEDLDKFIICQVPAYTEDEDSLRRAIDSLARLKYDDKRKLLCIICDGMIIGAGNDRPTPRIVLDILGVSPEIDPEPLSFESLGEGLKQHNMGKVYSGLYEVAGHIVPFVVIVKVGKPSEISRPGNRGKRDSQMLLMRFLNRVHYNAPMSPLELELYHQIRNVIGVSPTFYELLLQVDADTEVAPDSATRMVSAFLHDQKIIALCGETSLSNAKQTIITMIQVYEYYISHHLAKAFESLFGTVTCLPGCFSMYRIRTADNEKPLFVSNAVVNSYAEIRVDTLHMKNLLHLGEDRYLTTLLLKYHSNYKTKFIREAQCRTVAPDTWNVFISQRRRWINSTVHNLVELVPLSQLCGFCCFSMRFVVFLDLLSTIVQPVTVGYLIYLFYLLGSSASSVPLTSILILVSVYGLQAIIFILRRKWEMIGWMFFYILAIPVFSLAVPVYSFWHMDDFSWGNTRVVVGEKGTMVVTAEGKFDPAMIPKKRWEDFQAELWEQYENETMMDGKSDAMSMVSSYYPLEAGRSASAASSRPLSARPMSTLLQEYPEAPGVGYSAYSRPSIVTPEGEIELGTIEMPSDDLILSEIREIIRTSDLMTITKKSIRLELEVRFGGISLTTKRDYINSAIEAILAGDL